MLLKCLNNKRKELETVVGVFFDVKPHQTKMGTRP